MYSDITIHVQYVRNVINQGRHIMLSWNSKTGDGFKLYDSNEKLYCSTVNQIFDKICFQHWYIPHKISAYTLHQIKNKLLNYRLANIYMFIITTYFLVTSIKNISIDLFMENTFQSVLITYQTNDIDDLLAQRNLMLTQILTSMHIAKSSLVYTLLKSCCHSF